MAIDLLKKKVGIVLEKRKLPKITSEVKFALDISGSMEGLYKNGTVQRLVDRCLAVATQFDDDGNMEAWTFTNGFDRLQDITEAQHDGYVNKRILNNSSISKWGGTSYAPVCRDILQNTFTREEIVRTSEIVEEKAGFLGKLFGKKDTAKEVFHESRQLVSADTEHPALVIFITDGECGDARDAERVIIESQKNNIYWLMIGIGRDNFRVLRELGDKYPNVGFEKFDDIEGISDEDFYMKLLNQEFCDWAKQHAAQRIAA